MYNIIKLKFDNSVLFLTLLFGLLLSSCSSSVRFSDAFQKNTITLSGNKSEITDLQLKRGEKVKVIATYYDSKFHGRQTASGQTYNENDYTAAHKNLPFGVKLKVTNPKNGKSVFVVINDRGPFVEGRDLDLSLEAAKSLDIIKLGVAEVEIMVAD